jgi:hypothetical protein
MVQGLTDDWEEALRALKNVRIARDELTETEKEVIADAIQYQDNFDFVAMHSDDW